MKAKFLTIATIFTLALGTVTNTFAADKNKPAEEVSTTLTNVATINKIEIRGNVQVFVSDGPADQVKVYNRYYAESALVQNQNGTLRIASYNAKKLVVWVTASDLRAIEAYDNSEVKSFGNLSKIDLNVTLNNSASAQLDVNAYRANVTVNDRAKANVAGTISDYVLNRDQSATVNNANLVTVNRVEKVQNASVAAKNELAIL